MIKRTKKAKDFPMVRVEKEIYTKLQKLGKVRGWSLGEVIKQLLMMRI